MIIALGVELRPHTLTIKTARRYRRRRRRALLLEDGLLVGQLGRLVFVGDAAQRRLAGLDVGVRPDGHPAARTRANTVKGQGDQIGRFLLLLGYFWKLVGNF